MLRLIKGQTDEDDEGSPIKTKAKYYKKLLNFYNKVNPGSKPRSVSSPSKNSTVSKLNIF